VNGAGAARLLVLAATALIALLAALATERRVDPPVSAPATVLPLDGAWEQATVAPLSADQQPSGCGYALTSETMAVTHPVLPCGIRLVLDVDGRFASVQVAGHLTPSGPASFGLTAALARELAVSGSRQGRWALAAR
jgi:hypothetical protein